MLGEKKRLLFALQIIFFIFLFCSFTFSTSSSVIAKENGLIAQGQIDNNKEGTEKFFEERSMGTSSLVWATVKMLIVLVLVCLIAALVLRWFLPQLSGFKTSESDFVQVLKRIPLEPRKSIYLIRLGEEVHLLGVSDQNVNYLMPVPKEDVSDLLSEIRESASSGKVSFLKVLQNRSEALGKSDKS